MAKFLFQLSVGLVGCNREEEYEIDDEALEGLSPEEREDYINEEHQAWIMEKICGHWEEIEPKS